MHAKLIILPPADTEETVFALQQQEDPDKIDKEFLERNTFKNNYDVIYDAVCINNMLHYNLKLFI